MGPCEIPLPTTFAPSDANTSPGIVGATYNANDQAFMLRENEVDPIAIVFIQLRIKRLIMQGIPR